MKNKSQRLDAIKLLISTREIGGQEELRQELIKEGFDLTQATLSRDLKQLKVAKAATIGGKYVYVLPTNTMYRRVNSIPEESSGPRDTGFRQIRFSGNMAVIKTRPGYASSLAYDIDEKDLDIICGTIAGEDTIVIVMSDKATRLDLIHALESLIPNIR